MKRIRASFSVALIVVLFAVFMSGASARADEEYTFVTKWGSMGAGDGQFNDLALIGVDTSNCVYVADYGSCRIQKFDSSGSFITKWGSCGVDPGEFSPSAVAADVSGNVYVADYDNCRIQKFDSSGTFMMMWGLGPCEDPEYHWPSGIAIDSSGYVYVTDQGGCRIQKFNSSGTFITAWGSSGSGDGQFFTPWGIAVDSSGNVYVVDYDNSRIQKFNSSGTFITKWGSSGSGDGQFAEPQGIAVDSSGNVYVADHYNSRIQKFNSSGTFITKWGSSGSGDGQFDDPTGIAVDSSGNVYVADRDNYRIQKFAPDSDGPYTLTATIVGTGSGNLSASGLSCIGNTCTGTYPYNTPVTIIASPAAGSAFTDWTGCDSSLGATCNVTMVSDKTVTATFDLAAIDGVCGPANGGTFPSAPTTGLCSEGTPSTVIGNGPWTWTCQGLNGGIDASCSANLAGTSCDYTVSAPKPAKYKGGTVSLKVVASDKGCAAPNVVNTSGWIAGLPITWSNGKGTLKLTAEANDVASERSAEITVGDTPVTITQQGAPCKLSAFTPKKGALPSSGGTSSFSFTLPIGCGWTTALDEKAAPWLTLDTASGDGSGEIGYSASANTSGKPLSGKVIVNVTSTGAAKKYSVKQEK